ncbi:MAG: YggS family pyridoxal phosphate-dependent enzyme, partial [Pseudomonadota bacterium]
MLIGPQFSAGDAAARLAVVRDRIARACARAGRDTASVTLVGVSKTHPAAAVRSALDAGLRDFGENYVQEGVAKLAALPRDGVTWHCIGELQSTKTRPVAEHFDWVHTVDRAKLAERLSAQRPHHGPELQVCLQVDLDAEPRKGGVAPAELPALAAQVAALPRLRLRGLMCIPAPREDEGEQRRAFARLRELEDSLNAAGHALDVLSM